MSEFLDEYGNNITVIIVVLGFIVTLIVQWDRIADQTKKVLGAIGDKFFLSLFKLVTVAVSGWFIASLYWILVDFFIFDNIFAHIVSEVVSGAIWGIPVALIASRGKNLEAALVLSILVGIIALLLLTPDKILVSENITKLSVLILLWLASSISLAGGYAGYKTRCFLDKISPEQSEIA